MSKSNPLVPRSSEAFAYCIYADTNADYAVYKVAAKRGPDGTVVKVEYPSRDYPNSGTIRVLLRNLRLPASEKGNHAFLAFEEDPNFEEHQHSPKGIKYRATTAAPGGIEVVSIALSSAQPDEISELLRGGLEILGEPTGKAHVLLELNDGCVVGPIQLRATPESYLYRVEEQTLLTVKAAWKSIATLPVLSLEFDHRPQRFVFDPLPPSEFTFDLSPAAFAIKRALEYLIDQKAADAILSKNKARDLAVALAKMQPPEELKARCRRALVHLNRHASGDSEVDEFMKEVLKTSAVQANLIKEATAAREMAREAVQNELKPLHDEVKVAKAGLKLIEEQRTQASEDLATVEKKIEDAERRYAEVEKNLSTKLHAQVEKARTETADLLASITMLRPFLHPALDVKSVREPIAFPASTPVAAPATAATGNIPAQRMPIRWPTQIQPSALHDVRKLYSHLMQNLAVIGLKEPGASRFAAACVAAFSSGQAVSLRGSAANELAQALAASFFGEQWAEVTVPVGYCELGDLAALKPSIGGFGGVHIVGANRSCLDAYAGEWIAPFRMGGNNGQPLSFLLIFSLSEGPSALTISSQYSELGPVIHSDGLRWGARGAGKLSPGTFEGKVTANSFDWESESKLIDEVFAGAPNASAQLAARSALPLLFEMARVRTTAKVSDEQALREAMGTLTAWWIGPSVASAGKSREALAKLESLAPEDKLMAVALATCFGSPTQP